MVRFKFCIYIFIIQWINSDLNFSGCDWIHEISITVRSVYPTNMPNERAQRCAMLQSDAFISNLLKIASLQTADKWVAVFRLFVLMFLYEHSNQLPLCFRSRMSQSLALDILIWVIAIRLTRLRTSKDIAATRKIQRETVLCVQKGLPDMLRVCLLHAGRSIAHKCVKIIVLCSEYV